MPGTKTRLENATCPHCDYEHCDLTEWIIGQMYYCLKCRGKFVISEIETVEFYTTKTLKDFQEGQ